MIDDTFAKQDFSKGLDLEDLFKDLPTGAEFDADFAAELKEALSDLMVEMEPPELEGYRIYRFLVDGRYFYPVAGTLRNLPMGLLLFQDEMLHDNNSQPGYTTVPYDRIEAISWLPEEDATNLAAAIPFPMAA